MNRVSVFVASESIDTRRDEPLSGVLSADDPSLRQRGQEEAHPQHKQDTPDRPKPTCYECLFQNRRRGYHVRICRNSNRQVAAGVVYEDVENCQKRVLEYLAVLLPVA
jgi:hypothetical protein